jgi:hypothetical protein
VGIAGIFDGGAENLKTYANTGPDDCRALTIRREVCRGCRGSRALLEHYVSWCCYVSVAAWLDRHNELRR